eukprot:7098811-Prymnesium_polylepis.1
MQSPHPMAASRGYGAPRDGLFLLGISCASTLLSSAVGITITAYLYHSTHSALRNARIATQLDSHAQLWHWARYTASFAHGQRLFAAAAR